MPHTTKCDRRPGLKTIYPLMNKLEPVGTQVGPISFTHANLSVQLEKMDLRKTSFTTVHHAYSSYCTWLFSNQQNKRHQHTTIKS